MCDCQMNMIIIENVFIFVKFLTFLILQFSLEKNIANAIMEYRHYLYST